MMTLLEQCFNSPEQPALPALGPLFAQLQAHAELPVQLLLEGQLQQHPALPNQLRKILFGSQFAALWLCAHPNHLLELLTSPSSNANWRHQDYQQTIAAQLQHPRDEIELNRVLRQHRNRYLVEIIWRDFNRLNTTQETCTQLTALAEGCLQLSLEFHYASLCREFGTPLNAAGEPQPFLIIGMGKLGAAELNLSSDIDLIFAFPDAGQTSGGVKASIDNQTFFIKLGQKLISSLDATTADGFVFRVDMRLRPFGQSGALASNFDALEDYYHNQGREWERFAMVKARVVAHNAPAATVDYLHQLLRGFTYRRYVDFSVIAALRNLKLMIQREVSKKGKNNDIKLGRGGIREIEFIAQVFQLIHGGRDIQLQDRRLIPTLRQLRQLNCLPHTIDEQLIQAYYFLRNTEHALQGYQDRQTQQLPDSPEAQARLAWVMGYASWDEFWQQLENHRLCVAGEFQAVIAPAEGPSEQPEGQLTPWRTLWLNILGDEASRLQDLQQLGFDEPAASLNLLRQLQENSAVLAMQAQSRERLDDFMPRLLLGLVSGATPSQTLARLTPFSLAVARRSAYLVLLIENPQALAQLITLCEGSVWIAQRLSQHPALLDELLDPNALYTVPSKAELAQELRQSMLRIEEGDLEGQMENLRYFRWAQTLKAAACEVTGHLPLMRVSDYLSYLAEAILEYVLHLCWRTMVEKHGYPDGTPSADPAFIVLAYGKLGGLELGHGSDLDLVFIHNASSNGQSAGIGPVKSLENGLFYTRLAQKIIHILATKTASGELYEVDVRLRPSGNSGLLVSSLSAFAKYQQESAWTWEHQALVRARVVAGSPPLAEAFNQLRDSILQLPRNLPTLQQDVRDMRQKMREQLGSKPSDQTAGLFHLKQDAGGIVDIEFMVQYGVLAWAHANPTLTRYTDNIRILDSLVTTGKLDAQQANQLIAAYKHYRTIGHRLALQQAPSLIPREPLTQQIAQVTQLWQQLLGPE